MIVDGTTPEPTDPDADVPGDGSHAALESAADDLVEIYREADLDGQLTPVISPDATADSPAADDDGPPADGIDVCPLDAPAAAASDDLLVSDDAIAEEDAVASADGEAADVLSTLTETSPSQHALEAASDEGGLDPTDEDECEGDAPIEPALAEAAAETAFVGDVEEDTDDIELSYDDDHDEPATEEPAIATGSVAASSEAQPEPVAAAVDMTAIATPAEPRAETEPAAVVEAGVLAADDVLETSTYLAGAMILTGAPEPRLGLEAAPSLRRRDHSASQSAIRSVARQQPAEAVASDAVPAQVIKSEKPHPRPSRARTSPIAPAAAAPDALPTASAEIDNDELAAVTSDADDSFENAEAVETAEDDQLIEPSAVVLESDADEADGDAIGVGKSGGWWSIPLLCAGIAIVACCMVIPQADANRRLAYQRTQLRAELEAVQAQVATNDEFLRKLATDPTLAERLAQRQMKMMRSGVKPLPVSSGPMGTSPFELVQVPRPAQPPPYEPIGGRVASLTYHPRGRLYLMGGGLLVLAAALVLGGGGRTRSDI
jgi:hypothetical protein